MQGRRHSLKYMLISGILADRAGIGHVALNKRYEMRPSHFEASLLTKNCIFAHLSGRKRHGLRKELWSKILEKENDN